MGDVRLGDAAFRRKERSGPNFMPIQVYWVYIYEDRTFSNKVAISWSIYCLRKSGYVHYSDSKEFECMCNCCQPSKRLTSAVLEIRGGG